MIIEVLSLNDIDEIVNIENIVFKNADPWPKHFFIEELNNRNRIYLGIRENEEMIGYGGIIVGVEESDLMNIAISKKYQGKGFGKKLLSELIKVAKENNCKNMFLEVRISNDIAINLYKAFGFMETRIRKHYYENGEDCIEMKKELQK